MDNRLGMVFYEDAYELVSLPDQPRSLPVRFKDGTTGETGALSIWRMKMLSDIAAPRADLRERQPGSFAGATQNQLCT